ncbi:MAG: YbjN domain-containing protein [Chloracidobacterium sp.]|nr:YbjN domain-containing protein [Chloracidobacterium sp.]MDW8218340.1 hypothetical protein [Acidobacteriota bacterium]
MMRNLMPAALGLAILGHVGLTQETALPRRKPAALASGGAQSGAPAKPTKPPAAKPASPSQTPPDPNAPKPKPKPLPETLRGYLRQIKGVRLERPDKDPNTIVSRYTATSGETFDIVVIYAPRKKMVGLYSYAFGNVAQATDADELRALLLNANEAMAFGSFFVDKEQDIGLKWSLRTETPITFETFQTVYLGLAAAAKEYAPQIARRMKRNADDEAPPRNDTRDNTRDSAQDNRDAVRTAPAKVTRERRVSNPQQ